MHYIVLYPQNATKTVGEFTGKYISAHPNNAVPTLGVIWNKLFTLNTQSYSFWEKNNQRVKLLSHNLRIRPTSSRTRAKYCIWRFSDELVTTYQRQGCQLELLYNRQRHHHHHQHRTFVYLEVRQTQLIQNTSIKKKRNITMVND